jgi:hypothetical protein
MSEYTDAVAAAVAKRNAAPELPADHYAKMQELSALKNALSIARTKAQFEKFRGNAATRNADDVSTANRQPSLLDAGNGGDEGGDDDDLDWSKIDWSSTEQAAKAHRAEQRLKARHASESSDDWDLNTAQRRINSKPVSP